MKIFSNLVSLVRFIALLIPCSIAVPVSADTYNLKCVLGETQTKNLVQQMAKRWPDEPSWEKQISQLSEKYEEAGLEVDDVSAMTMEINRLRFGLKIDDLVPDEDLENSTCINCARKSVGLEEMCFTGMNIEWSAREIEITDYACNTVKNFDIDRETLGFRLLVNKFANLKSISQISQASGKCTVEKNQPRDNKI